MIIYPAIDIKNGRCVRLIQGDFSQETVYENDPAVVARKWLESGAAWLHLVDLDGAKTGVRQNDAVLQKILAAVDIPVQVGGGNRSLADIEVRLKMGVSRVIIGTAAITDPVFLQNAAAAFGEKIAVGIDARDGKVAISGWQAVSDVDVQTLCRDIKQMGIRTIIYTDIAKDGMMIGPNVEMYRAAVETGLSVIASGGVSCMADLARLAETGVAGAIVGKALYEKTVDLQEAVRLYG